VLVTWWTIVLGDVEPPLVPGRMPFTVVTILWAVDPGLGIDGIVLPPGEVCAHAEPTH
jgi:hypothetical protein